MAIGRKHVLIRRFLAIALTALPVGCGNTLGPERFKTTRVEGRVRIGLTPLDGGFIEFMPTGATVGIMTSGPIGSDGTFVVERAPVGEIAVGFFGGKLPRLLSRHFDTLGTTIRRTVPDSPSAKLDIDLQEEEYLYQKAMADLAAARRR